RICHLFTVAALVSVGFYFPEGVFYWAGCLIVGIMLVYEHRLVGPDDISRVDAAFFTVNGAVSILFFVIVLVDRLV
ncbi:MAG: 4-hydroxybenzoate octaprenyltransferase, partial [Gemmatimonadota bacterium]|nr:4-hydroxybenzoate octaprenyltransferase [Gemmatimonadota bacterium]